MRYEQGWATHIVDELPHIHLTWISAWHHWPSLEHSASLPSHPKPTTMKSEAE